ncbi:wsv375 [White spot syndrome virus]|uniref:Wsv375 n=4 Tax=White spot syndrome virus TaxID=342409 RepID=Q8VAM6_WSSVS|nr:wsv375 [Shrimp white spot syndrome virus]AFX59752.1 wsv375 [White spot syndrome virus]AAL33377.1 wsv375 [Shrimp white spot syndrome virus]AAL89302.1 WSSV434 [Shrimp white spot syndrome virus]AWQ60500.1 wsv375 [Shrimp white spot syndrome virus]AWQ60945.1 wsv375 [Shrimp white spot syndrome virus]
MLADDLGASATFLSVVLLTMDLNLSFSTPGQLNNSEVGRITVLGATFPLKVPPRSVLTGVIHATFWR